MKVSLETQKAYHRTTHGLFILYSYEERKRSKFKLQRISFKLQVTTEAAVIAYICTPKISWTPG